MSSIFTRDKASDIIKWAQDPTNIELKKSLKDTSYEKELKESKDKEVEWGNTILDKNENPIKQWTTRIGEGIVKQLLQEKGYVVKDSKTIEHRRPDVLTEDIVWEVKTRNWTCPGTAGEKVLGAPLKYCEVPRLFNKRKLIIIAIAYQEFEMCKEGSTMQVFGEGMSEERKKIINFLKDMNIYFLKFSDFIKMSKEELDSI